MKTRVNNLNFCRQMVSQFTEFLKRPNNPDYAIEFYSHCIDIANAAQKFILPDGGRLYDDPEYRALDENEPLRLPFPVIALEYLRTGKCEEGKERSSKAIVLAREHIVNIDKHVIVVLPVCWFDKMMVWVPFPEIVLPVTNYIDRNIICEKGSKYVPIRAYSNNKHIGLDDYSNELRALLSFINVLHCSNVRMERAESRTKLTRTSKTALPFDSYYVLKIENTRTESASSGNSTHRSPREHLRRGHIRRLQTGVRVWVNAAIVCAGKGAGIVKKDYTLNT